MQHGLPGWACRFASVCGRWGAGSARHAADRGDPAPADRTAGRSRAADAASGAACVVGARRPAPGAAGHRRHPSGRDTCHADGHGRGCAADFGAADGARGLGRGAHCTASTDPRARVLQRHGGGAAGGLAARHHAGRAGAAAGWGGAGGGGDGICGVPARQRFRPCFGQCAQSGRDSGRAGTAECPVPRPRDERDQSGHAEPVRL